MAEDTSHAAWHDKREFTVRVIPAEGPARDLISGFTSFLAAVDYVSEWLDREDPACASDLRLAVIQTQAGVSSEVFSYPPVPEPSAAQELVQRYGFNPAAPRSRPEDRARPRLDRLTARIARTPLIAPAATSPSQRPLANNMAIPTPAQSPVTRSSALSTETPHEPKTASAIGDATQPASLSAPPAPSASSRLPDAGKSQVANWRAIRLSIIETMRLAWNNRAARGCLVVAALSLWLTVTLTDPTFLIPLLASISALWLLHHRRPPANTDPDDWL